MSDKSIREAYPIHWLVWHNKYDELKQVLASGEPHELEARDPRGRTPVHLAVTLGHIECARVLFRKGANANTENAKYWSVTQEAVTTGDPELVQLCLQFRDYQRYQRRTEGVPELLQKLREAPDFYVEMKWEFTSWVPLVSRMCPSDVYKVWKSGPNVRIDTTLLGFDNMNWQRGSRSYIFKGNVDHALVMEVDHDLHQVYTETMRVLPEPPDLDLLTPSEDQIAARITTPIVTTYIDTEKISFERNMNKSGIWGWRSDKTEAVNGYDCKVFSATNVELVTKTRTEHLTEQDKEKTKKVVRTPLESFLGIAEQTEKTVTSPTSEVVPELVEEGATANGEVTTLTNNPTSITPEEYFNPLLDLQGRDIGRPIEQTTKTQKFKANLSLSENYPLSLPEQVVPIIDLMAASNAHFKKLKDFITLQLPSGFPVKIEIPLFHVLNARITFGNIFGVDSPAPGVQTIAAQGEEQLDCCVVEESCFDAPSTYSVVGDMGRHDAGRMRDEDDDLLQFAIQQSLLEPGTENDQQVTFWEALNKAGPPGGRSPSAIQAEEERQLQRALEESMRFASTGEIPEQPVVEELPVEVDEDEQVRLVMELSKQQMEADQARRNQEEEELERILQLSLTEK